MAVASMKDWLPARGVLPSWVLSGVFHAGLVWLMLWMMPAWDRTPVGDGDEPAREIGIFVTERGELVEPSEAAPSEANPENTASPTPIANDALTPTKAVPETPSVNAVLPQAEQFPGIGPGVPLTDRGLPDPEELIKASPGSGAGQASRSGGLPGTSFMGIQDEGSRVVYVVDSSGSMYQHNAMRAAKAALVASLNGLEKSQQFQIIFYNEITRVMSLKSAPKRQLYFATDLNKTSAQQFIQSIEPDLGTQHIDAIKLGLSFGPEVMFLLTDSGEPRLTPRELDDIQRRNGGKTRIHCIEFGIGAELSNDANFLKKLARQNGGTHRYVDVSQFSRK